MVSVVYVFMCKLFIAFQLTVISIYICTVVGKSLRIVAVVC